MSSYRASTIEAALEKKGFEKSNSHHKIYIFMVDGRKTSVHTRVSHGIDVYGDSLLGPMAKQMKLSKRQLADFIECPMSLEQYAEHLLTNQHIRKAGEAEGEKN